MNRTLVIVLSIVNAVLLLMILLYIYKESPPLIAPVDHSKIIKTEKELNPEKTEKESNPEKTGLIWDELTKAEKTKILNNLEKRNPLREKRHLDIPKSY